MSFTVPTIDAVHSDGQPAGLSTTPGSGVTDTITLTNVGNVKEDNVTLSSTTATGLAVSGLPAGPVSLDVGQSVTETVTLTPDPATPLNSTLAATITATFGPAGSPLTQSVTVPVQVVAPGVAAISGAAVAAGQAGNTNLGNQLNNLSLALTSLYQNPADPVANGQATAALDSLTSQVIHDPFLAPFGPALMAARATIASASTAAAVSAALTALGTALGSLGQAIADEAAHGFTLGLMTAYQQALPSTPSVFQIDIKNTGTQATTYDLSVSGLPANVNAVLSQATVTLQPGQAIAGGTNGITVSLTEAGDTLFPASFTVTATAEGATEITDTTQGSLILRSTFLQVASVSPAASFVAPGGATEISANVQSALNGPQNDTISYVVLDSTGRTVFTSAPVPLPLTISSALTTADLGPLDTAAAGLAAGTYTLVATVYDSTGQAVPGSAGEGTLFIGLPVTSTVTTTPAVVATGTATATTTVQIHGTTTFPDPLTVLGQVATSDNELSTVLYPNGNQELAYEVGSNGVEIVDVTDPSNPQFLSTFAADVIVKGGYNVAQVVGHDLIVATTLTLNASGFNLIVYDLTNPLQPSLVSNTVIDQRFLGGMYVQGNVAIVPLDGYFFGGNFIEGQFGNLIALDLSDLSHPTLAGMLYGSGDPGADHQEYGAVIVNSGLAYVAINGSTGSSTQSGVGQVSLVNISDPTHPTLAGTLDIPGTVEATAIALQGDRARWSSATRGACPTRSPTGRTSTSRGTSH